MSATPSPGISETSIPDWCFEVNGFDAKTDCSSCSPEVKRAKRVKSTERFDEERGTKNYLEDASLGITKQSNSLLSFRSLDEYKHRCIQYDRNSVHSLPNIDLKTLASQNIQSNRADAVEVIRQSQHLFERESDGICIKTDDANAKIDKKARVVSSYYIHHHNTELGKPFRKSEGSPIVSCPGASECKETPYQEASCEYEVVDWKPVRDQVTYETGKNSPECLLETLMPSRENCEKMSNPNSFLDCDVSLEQPSGNESEHTSGRTPIANAGDAQLWSSFVEEAFKSELHFSELVTLAYVRVRDLTNTISKASSYLEALDAREGHGEEEKAELRSDIEALFEERSKLALEQSKWREHFTVLYNRRKKVLSDLKIKAEETEQSYFTLRKELDDLQNEPIAAKPKKSWVSRLCGFTRQ